MDELEKITLGGTRDMGPCGGFSTQYMCMCDYHALPYREEVAWDVDTIYLSHDTRELYLHDFDYLEQKLVFLYLIYRLTPISRQSKNSKADHILIFFHNLIT